MGCIEARARVFRVVKRKHAVEKASFCEYAPFTDCLPLRQTTADTQIDDSVLLVPSNSISPQSPPPPVIMRPYVTVKVVGSRYRSQVVKRSRLHKVIIITHSPLC